LRAREAADRRADLTRAGLVMLALACAAFQALTIVPAMAAIADVKSVAYHALHNRSTMVYGGVVLCGFGALILAAIRDAD
jgi:hypothetical protein